MKIDSQLQAATMTAKPTYLGVLLFKDAVSMLYSSFMVDMVRALIDDTSYNH